MKLKRNSLIVLLLGFAVLLVGAILPVVCWEKLDLMLNKLLA